MCRKVHASKNVPVAPADFALTTKSINKEQRTQTEQWRRRDIGSEVIVSIRRAEQLIN
jgi:hypothetical protein